MALNDVFIQGYQKIQENEYDSQLQYLSIVAEARNIPVEFITKASGVFIPNNEFMLNNFGPEIQLYDCYRDGLCVWDNAVIFPIKNVNSEVVAFAGFYPFEYLDESTGKNYYGYSSKDVFTKGNFLFFPQNNLKKAIQDGYLMVVDGLFDAISLCGHGFNAASLMGSNVTPGIVMQLRLVSNVIVVADNDQVGYDLYKNIKKQIQHTTIFQQDKTKDIDELLKSDDASWGIQALNATVANIVG